MGDPHASGLSLRLCTHLPSPPPSAFITETMIDYTDFEADLKISAQTSLKALQIWSLGTPDLANAVKWQHDLDPEIASLVVACQHLRKNGYRKGRKRLAQNSILNRLVQAMVEDLTDDSLKIFALLTWHFNADFSVPLPRQLLLFFDEPSKIFEDVCTDIHRRYTTMAEPESVKSFKRRFIRLLGLVEHYVFEGKWSCIFKSSDYVIIVAAICQ